jgi:hypothetical protein
MQIVVDGQDTDCRAMSVLPAGSGVDWIDQLVPFQCSASTVPRLVLPTAVHDDVEGHETDASKLPACGPCALAGFGVGWTTQAGELPAPAARAPGPSAQARATPKAAKHRFMLISSDVAGA